MMKIIESISEKISNFIDTAYENEWMSYLLIGLFILFLIVLFYGKRLSFK